MIPEQSLSQRVTHLWQWLSALWTFARPHTIIGTSLSVVGLAAITGSPPLDSPVPLHHLSANTLLWSMGWAWIACLCGNVYIVGLNQLTDVDIDRINKPKLPLASGAFSRSEGIAIVAITGVLSLALAAWQGPVLLAMVCSSLLIGTAYSLPPIRLKRFAFWAALCIFGVRGVIVNLGLYGHFQQQWWGTISGIPPQVWVLTVFIVVYTFAIAIFKDIPDLAGDRQYQIQTLTVRIGAPFVFQLARFVMTACYLGIILAAWILPTVQTVLITSTHLLLLGLLWWRSLNLDLKDQRAIRRFYQLIWQLFYCEYILFPLACLWQ